MTKLYGVSLGENCNKYLSKNYGVSDNGWITVKIDEPVVTIKCGDKTSKVYAINANFRSVSYIELRKFISKEIGARPTKEEPDERCCEGRLFNYYFTGKSIWHTAIRNDSIFPSLELTVKNERGFGDYKNVNNYDSSLELISWKLYDDDYAKRPKKKKPLADMLN